VGLFLELAVAIGLVELDGDGVVNPDTGSGMLHRSTSSAAAAVRSKKRWVRIRCSFPGYEGSTGSQARYRQPSVSDGLLSCDVRASQSPPTCFSLKNQRARLTVQADQQRNDVEFCWRSHRDEMKSQDEITTVRGEYIPTTKFKLSSGLESVIRSISRNYLRVLTRCSTKI
jgi:hypothetical protein